MWVFKTKKELDNKSKHISIMYLYKAKTQLENELITKERDGESEIFTAKHDINCLENAIKYLEASG